MKTINFSQIQHAEVKKLGLGSPTVPSVMFVFITGAVLLIGMGCTTSRVSMAMG